MGDMLGDISRPTISVIKLVECCGILFNIPFTEGKGKYKAPIPSNYDGTVEFLDKDFGGCITSLAGMTSSDLSNQVANDLYAKTLEPGFDYETAVNEGGLKARDMFNAIKLIMDSLEEDKNRIPVKRVNVLTFVNGTKSSYAALDAATHIFKHGKVMGCALVVDEQIKDGRMIGMMKVHLQQDLERRMKMQYHLPDHCYATSTQMCTFINQIPKLISTCIENFDSHILVYGLEEGEDFGENGDGGIPRWLVTSTDVNIPVLFTKPDSRVRPFSEVNIYRNFVIYVDEPTESALKDLFLKALLYLRPGDSVILLSITEPNTPLGDGRDSRYEMGSRAGMWIDGENVPANQPDHPSWNSDSNSKLVSTMNEMISFAQVDGMSRLETKTPGTTYAQLLSSVVRNCDADFLVVRKDIHIEYLVDTVQTVRTSIMIL
jgi:hypothetical protein